MCPVNSYRKLFSGVNQAADPVNLTDLEKKHIPTIKAPATVRRGQPFAATVEIGRDLAHPNERDHFIEFIELYADESFLARVDLTAVTTCPKATLVVSLAGAASELRAYARCNLHGVWVGRTPIALAE